MVRLDRAVYDEIVAHALEDRPFEVCGILGGTRDHVTHAYRTHNTEQSPVRYEIDPRDLIRIFREIDDADLDHVGIYHSHTHTRAYPSETDKRLATYPEALYFIVSLVDERAPYVKAFYIHDGVVTEEPVEIE